MAVTTRSNLKQYFQTGDKPTQAHFEDLIDSFVHLTEGDDNQGQITNTLRISGSESYRPDPLSSVTSQLGMVVSGSILPGDNSAFDLGSKTERWRSGSFGRIGGSPLSKTDVDEIKDIEVKRKSDDGIPIKRLRSFEGASTFVDLNSTAGRTKTKGTAIDIFVKDNYEAFHVDPSLVSIGPVPGIPIEFTGSIKVGVSQFVPHEFKGKYEFKGNPDGFGNAGDGVVIQDSSFFNDEGGIVPQPGTISQSLNIGTATSPSINIMDGVGDSCFIRIADGITVRVNDGSIFKIQCPQPDISVDTDNGTITISDLDIVGNTGDITIFPNNGGNPTTIEVNTTIPTGQVSYWTVGAVPGTYTTADLENPVDNTGIQIGGLISSLFDGVIINGETLVPPTPSATSHNVKLRIQDGAELYIQSIQPDITVEVDSNTVTLSDENNEEVIINTGTFGSNNQYIYNTISFPSGQVAHWYGPIYIGTTAEGVVNNLGSLRLNENAQIRIQAF